jgi:release factor glutamine methyltransferase
MNLTDYLPAEWTKTMINLGGKTIGAELDGLIHRLEKLSETPGLDAQAVMARVIGQSRTWVLAHPEISWSSENAALLERLALDLESGKPLPYVLGVWEFFGLEFVVTPAVLIPRPETEMLVEHAIAWLKTHSRFRRAADIGTGSGCIGIAMAVNDPDLQVVATDISRDALKIARLNALNHKVGRRVDFLCCDLFPPEGEFDLILANLPYIPTQTLRSLPIFGHEPTLALDGGKDGLELIRRLLEDAPDRLNPGGLLLMEIEASQGSAALSLACDSFSTANIHLYKDLAGHDRILEIQV